MEELLALEAAEPHAEPPPVFEAHLPDIPKAIHTERYFRGLQVLRASLASDMSESPLDDDLGALPVPSQYLPAPEVVMAAAATGPPVPTSVREAMQSPEYLAPHGWHAAMMKEILRVERFQAMVMVPASEVRKAMRDHPTRTTVAFLVAIFADKLTPSGDPRQPDILHKFRIAYADSQGVGPDVLTFSSCVDGLSNVVITAVAPAIDAHQTSIDVGGAYYHGTPPSLADGGRLVFAHMPYWLPGLGKGGYVTRNPKGERMYLKITGNMPGRCDAGRIWQARFDKFLLGFGLRRLQSDLRVFTWASPLGVVVIHDHVDDTRITTTSPEARRLFTTAWALEFGEPLPSEELSEDFTGLRHHRVGPSMTEISCMGVLKRLVPLVANYATPSYYECPLPEDAIRKLRECDEQVDEAHRPADIDLKTAQQILGTVGFAATTCRPDVCFAYHLLSRYVNPERFRPRVMTYLLRVAHYLLSTLDLHLCIDTPQLTHFEGPNGDLTGLDLFYVDVDSSSGNGPSGHSFGGFVLMSRGLHGGAIAWKTILPKTPSDSTGAAELILCTHALKVVIAVRLLQAELRIGVAPTTTTDFFTDAKAVVEGAALERLTRTSRWLSMRYAMMRWGLACKVISLRQKPAADNVGDLTTKPVVGYLFKRLRSRLMGLRPLHPYFCD